LRVIVRLHSNQVNKFISGSARSHIWVEKLVYSNIPSRTGRYNSCEKNKIMETLSIDDVKEFKPGEEKTLKRKPLGFRF